MTEKLNILKRSRAAVMFLLLLTTSRQLVTTFKTLDHFTCHFDILANMYRVSIKLYTNGSLGERKNAMGASQLFRVLPRLPANDLEKIKYGKKRLRL